MITAKLNRIYLDGKRKGSLVKPFGRTGTKWLAFVGVTADISNLPDLPSPYQLVGAIELFVTSPENLQDPITKAVLDKKYTIVQDEFDLGDVEKIAAKRLGEIEAKTPEELTEQLNQKFLYRDSDD